MRRLALALSLLTIAGCQKSDTETMARIGRKLATKGQVALGDLRGRVGIDLNWQPPGAEPSLEERVRLRLRFERELAEVPIEIKLHGAEVELLGKVSDPEHKRRAVELAETTRGVEMVTDHIELDLPAPPMLEPMPESDPDPIREPPSEEGNGTEPESENQPDEETNDGKTDDERGAEWGRS